MQNEIWKDVLGYEGAYQVSNLGRVKSLPRLSSIGRLLKEKTMKLRKKNNGYLSVGLHKNNKQKTYTVHRLVAIAFLNHKPNGYNAVVDHVNGSKTDNSVENLQIVSQRCNVSRNRKGCYSKYTGVSFDKRYNKWRSEIYINGKSKYLGSFTNEYDAHLAYQEALKTL